MEHFTREESLCIFTPLPPKTADFRYFWVWFSCFWCTKHKPDALPSVLYFCVFVNAKWKRRFAYTLLNQQMNHLLIIIYIIGTHTCFHKNTKTQKCKGASAEHQAGLAVMPSDAAFRWLNIKMQNMSTEASLHYLCRLTKHLNFFYTSPGALHGKNYGMA